MDLNQGTGNCPKLVNNSLMKPGIGFGNSYFPPNDLYLSYAILPQLPGTETQKFFTFFRISKVMQSKHSSAINHGSSRHYWLSTRVTITDIEEHNQLSLVMLQPYCGVFSSEFTELVLTMKITLSMLS